MCVRAHTPLGAPVDVSWKVSAKPLFRMSQEGPATSIWRHGGLGHPSVPAGSAPSLGPSSLGVGGVGGVPSDLPGQNRRGASASREGLFGFITTQLSCRGPTAAWAWA